MAKIITEKAQIQCTLGAKPQKIIVTSQTFMKIENVLIATEDDKQSIINIPSFGNCKCSWTNPPCVPSPQNWQKTTEIETINGKFKLTESSFCMCAKGGKISFMNTGENTFVDGE